PLQNSTALLCQGSLQELVDALQRIQSYPVRSPLIAKGLEQAKELSWATVAAKLWDIFEQVAPSESEEPTDR
ncbi:glycosyltransferase involved in cell wall biosynthesis, partial [Thermostichus sp. MS-CIW-18]